MSTEKISNELQEAMQMLEKFKADPLNLLAISEAATVLVSAINNGGKVFSCGNGGSMSDAMHFAEELGGRFRNDRAPIPALAISDIGQMTCTANDYGYAQIFARFIEGFANGNDALLAISTSGNSDNVINAAIAARNKRMKVIGLTGNEGGKLKEYCDVVICAPHARHTDRIQEIHIKVIHILVMLIEQEVAH